MTMKVLVVAVLLILFSLNPSIQAAETVGESKTLTSIPTANTEYQFSDSWTLKFALPTGDVELNYEYKFNCPAGKECKVVFDSVGSKIKLDFVVTGGEGRTQISGTDGTEIHTTLDPQDGNGIHLGTGKFLVQLPGTKNSVDGGYHLDGTELEATGSNMFSDSDSTFADAKVTVGSVYLKNVVAERTAFKSTSDIIMCETTNVTLVDSKLEGDERLVIAGLGVSIKQTTPSFSGSVYIGPDTIQCCPFGQGNGNIRRRSADGAGCSSNPAKRSTMGAISPSNCIREPSGVSCDCCGSNSNDSTNNS